MNQIQEEVPPHRYYTEIPNIVFEMNLTPYELSAYCHMKRTTGENGVCFKTCQKLSEEIGCHRSKFIEVKKSLESKGLIRITHRKKEDGGCTTDIITIIDLWPRNIEYMLAKKRNSTPHVAIGDTPPVATDYPPCRQGLPKEQPILRKTHNNNKGAAAPNPAVVVPSFIQEIEDITQKDKLCLSKIESNKPGRVKSAIEWAKTQKIKTTKMALIRWHAETEEEIPIVKKKGDPEINKHYAKIVSREFKKKDWKIDILTTYVEISNENHPKTYCFEYKDVEFEKNISELIDKINRT